MPRSVFRLLWQSIEDGEEIFAYVLNLAADGGHYWVFAHVTPSVNVQGKVIGYHSNRRWVEPEICAEVAALYAVVRAAEQRETHTPAAIEAGVSTLTAHREGVAAGLDLIADFCRRVAEGDLEHRLAPLHPDPQLAAVRSDLNRMVDIVEAYVRESAAVLTAAQDGRFHRRFLVRGIPGSFRTGAARIDEARGTIAAASERAAREETDRAGLGERMSTVSTRVAGSARELAASASALATASQAVEEAADDTMSTVATLERTSREIQDAVQLIRTIAGRTRLLALNATIEAARAGDAGLGFAVVASEVRTLSDNSAHSLDDITEQVLAAQEASAAAADAIGRVRDLIAGMGSQVGLITAAAGGAGSGSDPGLAEMAEELRVEIEQFTQRT